MKGSLTAASASGVALWVCDVVAAFIVSPLLIHGLGVSQYGAWDIVVALIGYFGFLDLGISPAIMRFVAHSRGAGNKKDEHRYFSTGFWLLSGSGFAAALIFWVMSLFAPNFLMAEPAGIAHLEFLLMVVGGLVALSMPINALAANLLGKQRNVPLNCLRMLLTALRAIATVACMRLASESRLLGLAVAFLLILVFEIAIISLWLASEDGWQVFSPRLFCGKRAKEMARFGVNGTLLVLGTGSLRKAIGIVIAKVMDLAAVTYFAIAARLIDYCASLTQAIGYPLTPHLARAAGSGNLVVLRNEYVRSTKILQVFAFGVPIGTMWLGEPFLSRWLGSDMTKNSQPLLNLLGLSLMFSAVAINANRILSALALQRVAAVTSAVSAPLLLVGSISLTRSFGLYGAASAVAVHIALNAIVEVALADRALKVSVLFTLKKTILPHTVPLLILSSVLLALRTYEYPASYLQIAAYALVAGAAYGCASLWLTFGMPPLLMWKRYRLKNGSP
jgi:O-antigen/teichoic acid export membrane protein